MHKGSALISISLRANDIGSLISESIGINGGAPNAN